MNSIVDELRKLQQLLDVGTLSEDEFAQAKAALLNGSLTDAEGNGNDQRVTELQLQNELLRIDQQWQAEREHHMLLWTKHGGAEFPTLFGVVASLLFGLVVIGFGIFWVSQDYPVGVPVLSFPVLFGPAIIAFGIGVPIYCFIRYSRYTSAYDNYRRRRSDALAKLEKCKPGR